jgi:hypothetical protein
VRYLLTEADIPVIRYVEGEVVVAVNRKHLSERCRGGGTSKIKHTNYPETLVSYIMTIG